MSWQGVVQKDVDKRRFNYSSTRRLETRPWFSSMNAPGTKTLTLRRLRAGQSGLMRGAEDVLVI